MVALSWDMVYLRKTLSLSLVFKMGLFARELDKEFHMRRLGILTFWVNLY
jgi:hypothetical protein